MDRRQIKKRARASLKGLWGSAVALLLLLTGFSVFFILIERTVVSLTGMMTLEQIISSFPIYRTSFFSLPFAWVALILFLCSRVLSYFFQTPLRQGIISWYYRRAGGETPDVRGAFFYYGSFRRWIKTIALDVLIGLKKAFWYVLFLSPAVSMLTFGGVAAPFLDPGWRLVLLTVLPAVIGAIGALVARIVCYRYFAVRYIYADDPSVSIRVLFRSSVRVLKGKKGSLFLLDLSLIPAYAVSLAVLPCIWTVPYIHMVRAFYARRYFDSFQTEVRAGLEAEDQGESYDEF